MFCDGPEAVNQSYENSLVDETRRKPTLFLTRPGRADKSPFRHGPRAAVQSPPSVVIESSTRRFKTHRTVDLLHSRRLPGTHRFSRNETRWCSGAVKRPDKRAISWAFSIDGRFDASTGGPAVRLPAQK
jgi:hypothetical protein